MRFLRRRKEGEEEAAAGSGEHHAFTTGEKAIHVAGLVGIAFVSYKIGLPILKAIGKLSYPEDHDVATWASHQTQTGGLVFGRRKKPNSQTRVVVADDSVSSIAASISMRAWRDIQVDGGCPFLNLLSLRWTSGRCWRLLCPPSQRMSSPSLLARYHAGLHV